MKRPTIAVIISIILVALCFGQYGYRGSPRKVFQLTAPKLTGPMSFEQVLASRRPARGFTDQPLSFPELGQLAWAGQGITEPETGMRTVPSAGEIYPISLYFATQDGLFVYNPEGHNLEQTSLTDVRGRLAAAALEPGPIAEAGCDIIVAGSVRKLAARYGKDAKRYMLLEAGHIAQNVLLQAVGLELAALPVSAFDIREVSRVCRLPKGLDPVYMICVGHTVEESVTQAGERARPRTKRAALIIAGANFQDQEFFETRLVLEDAGVETVTVSSRTGVITGMLGGTAEAVVLLGELRIDDFDALVFVGGVGAVEYFNNPLALDIVREAADKRKVLAAICVSPAVLANAGLLQGVRATSSPSERARLQLSGAEFTGAAVERDGPIITAAAPAAAARFGHAIADALAEMQ